MKTKVFVIMPFQDEFFEVYEMLKMSFEGEYEFSNAGDEGNQQNIMKDIIEPIYKSDIIIADLTGLNPNVMYELGIAHTFNKKTIVITQDDLSKLPFDLKQYRAKNYSTHFKMFAELVEYLKNNMHGAVSGEVIYSNPVKDFIQLANIERNNWFDEKTEIDILTETDKGFIDFLADIEDSAEKLSEDISQMTLEMNTMSNEVYRSANEIERVNKAGGSGTASFARKETKRAAKAVETFSSQLRGHNNTIQSLWNEIESNTFGLLENKFSSSEQNKNYLIGYLKSLSNMKEEIKGSNLSIQGLIESMQSNVGIERSMNQAINFVEQDLKTYLDITERMSTSIDKILEKSKFVVGNIDFDEANMDNN